jgi:hypothetical protein
VNSFSCRVQEQFFPQDGIHEFKKKNSMPVFWSRIDRVVCGSVDRTIQASSPLSHEIIRFNHYSNPFPMQCTSHSSTMELEARMKEKPVAKWN